MAYVRYSESYIKSKGLKYLGTIKINATESDIKSKFDAIPVTSDRIALLIYVKNNYSSLLGNYLSNSSRVQDNIMKAVLMDYNYFDYDAILDQLTNVLIPNGFDKVLTSSGVTIFREDILDSLSFDVSVDLQESLSTALSIWQSAIKLASQNMGNNDWATIDYEALAVHDITPDFPSGSSTIESSNYIGRTMYIFEVDSSGILNQVFPPIGTVIIDDPTPFMSNKAGCDFGRKDTEYKYNVGIITVISLLMAIVIICVILCSLWLFKHRKHAIVQIVGIKHLVFILLGVFVLCLSPITFIVPPNNDSYCNGRVIFIMIGVLFIYSSFYSLTMRNLQIYRSGVQGVNAMGNVYINFICLGLIEMIFLIVWFINDAYHYTKTYSSKYSTFFEDVYFPECEVSGTSYLFGQIAICFYITLVTPIFGFFSRQLLPVFNETASLFYTTVITYIFLLL